MEKAQPDEGILELDLHAIKEEEWDALMEAQLSPDNLLAAVLRAWSEQDSVDSYSYAEDDVLCAAEDEDACE